MDRGMVSGGFGGKGRKPRNWKGPAVKGGEFHLGTQQDLGGLKEEGRAWGRTCERGVSGGSLGKKGNEKM